MLDLMGFWFMWQACGGFDGTQQALCISSAQMYKRIVLFRQAFGEQTTRSRCSRGRSTAPGIRGSST
ncbi:hypothetical protein [Agromyces protaetiae]|uniref:hypothetical protein n=1 Tax=Agromyces protaetiae TaxID=2509455 RepID=UPI0013ED1029|nr:hypothetical protein [Agromyces protaetiae]